VLIEFCSELDYTIAEELMKTMKALDRLAAERKTAEQRLEEGFTLIEAEETGAGDVGDPIAADDRAGRTAVQLSVSSERFFVLAADAGRRS
jgi:hypothetical protein